MTITEPNYDDSDEHSLLDQYGEDPSTPTQQRDDYLVRVPRKEIRKLEESNKTNRATAKEVDQVKRENAMLKAGIDTDNPQHAYFFKGYDGDLDPEKVKAAAVEAGILSAESTENEESETVEEHPDTTLEEGEADLENQRQQMSSGSPADEPPAPDAYKRAVETHDRIKAEGGQERQALGGAFNSLVNAAHQGDQSVVIPSRSTQALGDG